MLEFPPPAADRPLLAQLRAIDVGPGLNPEHDARLSLALRNGMRAAVRKGPSKVLSAFLAIYRKQFTKHNGYFISDLGDWGTDYLNRAIGDRIGLGGQRASIATYPFAVFDDTKALLTGSKRYVLHIARGGLPPVKAFWSLTMYNDNSFFVPNPLGRYLVNGLSRLHTNPDGSIDIYIQHRGADQPGAGQQLAARDRRRGRLPPDLAVVRPRGRDPGRARRLGLAAARDPAVRPHDERRVPRHGLRVVGAGSDTAAAGERPDGVPGTGSRRATPPRQLKLALACHKREDK